MAQQTQIALVEKKTKSKYRLTTPKLQWFTHINPTSHMTLENIAMNRNNKIQQVSGMSVKKMFQHKKITWHALLNQHWKCIYEKKYKRSHYNVTKDDKNPPSCFTDKKTLNAVWLYIKRGCDKLIVGYIFNTLNLINLKSERKKNV